MALLTGSLSVTRYNVLACPPELDFEPVSFRELSPGSSIRESIGVVPFEPDAPYEVGAKRWAFRVRIDKVKADPTAVRERVKLLEKSELEMSGLPFIGPKKRKELRHLAEEELIEREVPKTTMIECCLDGKLLWIGTAAKAYLGTVVLLLKRLRVEVQPKTPWSDFGLPEAYSDIVETSDQSESVHGCHFLRELLGDRDFLYEPESGRVRLATHEARIGLTGGVLPELHRYVQKGAEVLAGKLLTGEISFTLDGPTFRLSGVKLAAVKTDHWTEALDVRLAQLEGIYDRLDTKFKELVAS
jgi:hypothetical protein